MASSNYAEYHRGFLLYLLREKWRARGPFDIRDENAIKLLQGKGLYFIFWSAYEDSYDVDKQDQIYPLYVGITGRSFAQRFSEHCNRKSGVVNKINNRVWPTKGGLEALPGIVAYVVDANLPVAKFLESTFLYIFDFAMNEQENGDSRPEIDPNMAHKIEGSLETFEAGYEYMRQGVEVANKMLSGIKDGSKELHHYQFE